MLICLITKILRGIDGRGWGVRHGEDSGGGGDGGCDTDSHNDKAAGNMGFPQDCYALGCVAGPVRYKRVFLTMQLNICPVMRVRRQSYYTVILKCWYFICELYEQSRKKRY